jgi:trigger factor
MADEQTTETKNTVTIKDAGPCKKKVTIEIPEETIKAAADDKYEQLRKEAVLPGFRRGRAPRRLLEKRFGKETSEQIKLKLLADASESALKDNNIDSLNEPDIDVEKIELPETGSMKFEFEVEVKPEFKLPKLEGIDIKKAKFVVTDDQVAAEIEQLQKYAGMWTPREKGKVELDDQIIADAIIKTEGIDEEQKLDNEQIFVRKQGFVADVPVENLDEHLVGAAAGETKKITTEVAKTYFKEQYRGKKVDLQIDIKDIKFLKPAELNEASLNRFGVKNKAELEEKIRDSLQARLEQRAKQNMAEQIYKYLLDNTKFDLPLDIVARQSQDLQRRQYVNLLRQGLSKEQIDEQIDKLKAASDEQAKEQLKTFFIMDKTAGELGIKVTEEEINGYIAQLAIQRGQRPERLREQMAREGSLTQIGLQLRDDKCIEKLLETAKITETEPKKETKKKTTKKIEKKTVKKSGSGGEKKAQKTKKTTKKKTKS